MIRICFQCKWLEFAFSLKLYTGKIIVCQQRKIPNDVVMKSYKGKLNRTEDENEKEK